MNWARKIEARSYAVKAIGDHAMNSYFSAVPSYRDIQKKQWNVDQWREYVGDAERMLEVGKAHLNYFKLG